jgi:hypothetical protein
MSVKYKGGICPQVVKAPAAQTWVVGSKPSVVTNMLIYQLPAFNSSSKQIL